MANYAARGASPATLTEDEQRKILGATGASSRTFRDHVLLSLALGTGAREHELAALDRSDVVDATGAVRRRVALRVFKGRDRARPGAVQWLILPDEARRKLAMYVRDLPDGPLFPSRQGGAGARLSTRQIRELWRRWQLRAGLERHHGFHAIRHTYGTNLYAATRDLVLTQRGLRHRRSETTLVYVSTSDEAQERAARRLRC
jgi:integrase